MANEPENPVRQNALTDDQVERLTDLIGSPDLITDDDVQFILNEVFVDPGSLRQATRKNLFIAANIPITNYSILTDNTVRNLYQKISGHSVPSSSNREDIIKYIKRNEAQKQDETSLMAETGFSIQSVMEDLNIHIRSNKELDVNHFLLIREVDIVPEPIIIQYGFYTDSMDPNYALVVSDVEPIYRGLISNPEKVGIETYHEIMGGRNGAFFCHYMFPLLDGDDWKRKIADLCRMIGLNMKLHIDTIIDLLWNESVIEGINSTTNNYAISTYKMTVESMRSYLQSIGVNLNDEASIVSAYCTGKYIDPSRYADYMKVIKYLRSKPPFGVLLAALAVRQYLHIKGIIPIESDTQVSPYRLLLTGILNTKFAQFCLNIKGFDHLAESMKKIGMIPTGIPFEYFIRSISSYENIFNRPPLMNKITINTPQNEFVKYTDREIFSSIEPSTWNGREPEKNHIKIIFTTSNTPQWSFRKNKSNNLHAITLMGETYLEQYREDPNHTFISYGTNVNYRCFTATDLADSFQEATINNEEKRVFLVPGYLNPNMRDENYPNDTLSDQQTFTDEQTIELYMLLKAIPQSLRPADVINLFNVLETELRNIAEASSKIREWISMYKSLDQTRKNLFRWYVYWFIVFSIWVRKWKGPGHIYPHDWVDDSRRSLDLEKPVVRDLNVTEMVRLYYILKKAIGHGPDQNTLDRITNVAYRSLINPYVTNDMVNSMFGDLVAPGEVWNDIDMNNKLNNLFQSLKFVEFDFNGNMEYKVTTGNQSSVETMLSIFLKGEMCAGLVGDLITKTSIFYAWKLLGDYLIVIPSTTRDMIIRLYPNKANANNTPPYDIRSIHLTGHLRNTVATERILDVINEKPSKKDIERAAIYFGPIAYFIS